MIARLRARNEEGWALRRLLLLIGVTFVLRVILAASLGLGVDESYTVATSRVFALGTFDHPPLAWWLSRSAAVVFGTEAALAVRLPFILLAALSTWLIYDVGRFLYSPRAGLFAAVAYTLAPVLAWTSGSMVLPDGPLVAAMLAALCCLARAFFGDPRQAWKWWLLAGIATGLACLSKLHGIFLLAGTGLFVLTSPVHRRWLLSPWPYLATFVALAVLSPFLIWNAENHWISFAFQAGRARTSRLDFAGPFVALAGQSLFVLPWVWAALMISLGRALWNGPKLARDWLLFCLAIGPVAVFTLVALTGTKTLFHWAAPGYVFACVLLGRDLDRDLGAGLRAARWWLYGSAASLALLFASVMLIARSPWPDIVLPGGRPAPYPLIETQSWSEVRDALAARHLLSRPNTFVAGLKWHEAGRLDIALAGVMPVRCLSDDARGYGVLYDNAKMRGSDALIVTTALRPEDMQRLSTRFQSIRRLDDVTIHHAGKVVQRLEAYLATGFNG